MLLLTPSMDHSTPIRNHLPQVAHEEGDSTEGNKFRNSEILTLRDGQITEVSRLQALPKTIAIPAVKSTIHLGRPLEES